MAPFSFYWHDYETFGVVPRRDRPAQFAGVRTDAELNEIDAPLMLYCQPGARLPARARGLPAHRHHAAGVPGSAACPSTTSPMPSRPSSRARAPWACGYNTIRFDDEVTRHLFWRNLIDPYAREWQNECGRWDLLDVVRCAWALRPDGIEWPTHDDGKPSFKLEHLTAANGLAHDAAHDALSDVRATIALARLVKSQPAQAVGRTA